jgi:uncharacterized repeat protein (TIGR01451 family)
MKRLLINIGIALALGLGMAVLLLCALDAPPVVYAAPGTLYVATDGNDLNDCASIGNRCRTVQRAIDVAAPGDEIWVATGVYTGVHTRDAVEQVVYVTETLTIRGGYSGDFGTWDPDTYPTTIDAEQGGRVVYITGNYTPTLEALRLTDGSTSDRGGGVYARWAHPVISGCHIYSNTAEWGGGVYLADGDRATLTDNMVYDNEATVQNGGGIYLMSCPYAVLTGNTVHDNEAYQHSGGISLHGSEGATLTSNEVYSNTAQSGGGMQVSSSDDVALLDNHVYDNTATDNWCGGIRVSESHTATLTGNHVYSNRANLSGGGVCVFSSFDATLTGNHAYSNTAGMEGGGLYLSASTWATLMGNHVYSNTSGSFGGGIYLAGSFTSTLTGNHVYGNTANAGGGIYTQISSDSTLTGNEVYSNTAESGGGIYLVSSSNITLTTNQVYSNTASVFGGGILVHAVTSTVIIENEVYSNAAEYAGGIKLSSNDAVLQDNHVHHNTARANGGGISVSNSDRATLSGNDVHHNTAISFAAGIYLQHNSTATLTGNEVYSNTSGGSGGGVTLGTSPGTTLTDNRIHHNTAAEGGGVHLTANDDTTIEGNWVYGNTTIDYSGAGVYIRDSSGVELVNNLVTENRVVGGGTAPGIYCGRANVRLLHNTLARNTGGGGSGIKVVSWEGVYSSVWLTNTILVSHTVGISVTAGNTATLNATLWGNDTDWHGSNIFTGTHNWWGDPGFVDPDNGDYHIGSSSAGLDAGVEAGVSSDIDGDGRPYGVAPDLGADEVLCYVRLDGTYYPTVQAAVDASASSGDVIQVAGICRGVGTRGSVKQVVYITKTLAIRGGYSLDFSTWDPDAYPTLLDAQDGGPVVRMMGQPLAYITATLEGLQFTNGWSGGNGGGIYGQYVHAVIRGCHVYSNTGKGSGGGFYCSSCDGSILLGNLIYGNTVQYGIASGGGIYFDQSDGVQVVNNQVYDNLASSSFAYGGGVCFINSDNARMVNNVIARNQATGSSTYGSGLCFFANAGTPVLHAIHTTLAENSGGGGQGIYVVNSGAVVMTNTILVSHTVGIQTSGSAAAGLNATLWGNDTDWSGSSIVTGAYNWWGDSSFVDPEGRNYHLDAGSAALDKGLASGVSTDIDGDPRAFGLAPDLGADEGVPELALAKGGLGWVNEGQVYTYTLSVTNSGAYTATNAVLTDAVPSGADFSWASDGGVEGSGVVSWPAFAVLPGGGVVTRTFAVKAGAALTNSDYLVTADGIPSTAGLVFTTPLNLRPVAEAGDHQIVHSGVVTLDGSSSYDPEGDEPLDYSWLQQMGPVAVTLNNANTAVATFTAPAVTGLYRFRLFITDTRGARDSDWVNITISNDPPMADAGAPQMTSPSATVTLDGSGSSDPDGDALTYGWAQSGGISVTLSNSAAISPTFAAPTSLGVLTFTLTVTDSFGLADTDVMTVAVAQYRIHLPLVLRSYP